MSEGSVSRRVFLGLAGVGTALAAGAAISWSRPWGDNPKKPQPTATPHPTPSPSTPSPTHTPTPTATPSGPGPITAQMRQEVLQRFQSRKPAWWSMEGDGIISRTSATGVALTFDACGGPEGDKIDTELIDYLTSHAIPATLFLNSRWIKANMSYAKDLASEKLFELGNHGTRHLPLSVTGKSAYGIAGTANAKEVIEEIAGNHNFMGDVLGKYPRFFRSGTAHYDDVSVQICRALGETPVGFSINGDAGATFTQRQVNQEVSKARAGDIVISHMNQPRGQTFEGYRQALPALKAAGVTFCHIP